MPCCGGQPLAYLRREVPDRRDVGLRAQGAYEIADVATLRAEVRRAVRRQCLSPDNRRLFGFALGGVGGGKQGEVEGPAE
jgi:hypothetical protein